MQFKLLNYYLKNKITFKSKGTIYVYILRFNYYFFYFLFFLHYGGIKSMHTSVPGVPSILKINNNIDSFYLFTICRLDAGTCLLGDLKKLDALLND